MSRDGFEILNMEWTNEKVMRFLELYQMQPCIWDPKHLCHKVKTKISDAWVEIKNNMGEPTCTVKELKKKKDSLMSMYRGYKFKIKKSQVSGTGASEVYKPTWFAYECMDSFLAGIYKCNQSMNTEDNHNQQDAEQTDDTSTNYGSESNAPTLEEEHPDSSSTQQTPTLLPSKRRHHNPPELQQAKRQMDQAFNLLQNIAQPQHTKEDDECSIFGKLVAHKMRKLNDNRRDLMMIKINQLIYDEYNHQALESNSPHSTCTPSPIPVIQSDSRPQTVTPMETTQSTHTEPYIEVPSHSEEIPSFESSDYMRSAVDPPATSQPSNLIPIYKGPASKLPKYVILKKHKKA